MISKLVQKSVALRKRIGSQRGKAAIWLLFFNYFQAIVTCLINFYLANKLGHEKYGIIGYGLVVGAILKAFINFGNERTLVRDLTHTPNPDEMLSASIVLRSISAAFALIGLAVWLIGFPPELGEGWPIVFCAIAGGLMGLTPKAWYDFRYEMNIQAGLLLLEKIVYGVLLYLFLSMNLPVDQVLLVAVILMVMRFSGISAQWYYALKSFRPTWSNLKKNLLWLYRENFMVFLATLGNLVAPYMNQLFLGHKDGLAELGKYFIAFQIYTMIQMLQQIFNRLFGPRIAQITQPGSDKNIMKKKLFQFLLYSFLMNLSILLPLILLAPWAFETFLRAEYAEAVVPFQILCTSTFLFGLGMVLSQFVICLRLNAHYFGLSMSRATLAIVVGVALIPKYGLIGVALTQLITRLVFLVVQFTLAWRGINAFEENVSGEVQESPVDEME